MDRALHATAFKEREAEIRILRAPFLAVEDVLAIRVEFAAADDAAAEELVKEFGAVGACPAVDAVDFKGRVAPAVVGENPAACAGDGGGGGVGGGSGCC